TLFRSIEKTITDFPKKTAKANWYMLILDNPATIFMTEDGEKGKHSKRNKGPKPCFSTHAVTFCTCLFLRILIKIGLSPSLRMIINTRIDPKLVPTHEYKKPFNKP